MHTETGKKWEMKAYHTWDFKDGLIVSGGDYFDASGLINFLEQKDEIEIEVTQ